MKSLSILVAAASVAVATFDNLPGCGQVCMTNMNNIAINEFGCAQGNILCYCEKINYGYGVRDCANEACSSPQDAANVISYASNYCAGALSSAAPSTPSVPGYSILSSAAGAGPAGPSGPSTTPSPTGTGATGTGTGTGGTGTGGTGTGGTGTGGTHTGSGSAMVTSGSHVFTPSGAISTISSVNRSMTSGMSGAATSAMLTASGSATSTNSVAAAPLVTAAPLLGAGAMALLWAAL